MLASLLPGLRELRAPLATGYLWLVALWLAFGELVPRGGAATGVVADVYAVAGAVGVSASLAATAFAAYLVGLVSVQMTSLMVPMLRMLRRRRVFTDGAHVGSARPSDAGRRALRVAVLDQLAERSAVDEGLQKLIKRTEEACGSVGASDRPSQTRRLLEVRIDVEAYATRLEQDLPLMPLRLLTAGTGSAIYGEFDRLRAEAEFRASTAVPLAAIALSLSWRQSPWWGLMLAIPVVLVFEAKGNVTAATDILAEFIRARPAESPVLADMRDAPLQERESWVWFAADKDFPEALWSVAQELDATGDSQAEEWYRRAAHGGIDAAILKVAGSLYRRGDPEAETWYVRATQAGIPEALEIARAKELLSADQVGDLKLAHAGDPAAMTRVGAQLVEHDGDTKSGEDWYRKAANMGYRPAMQALAAHLRAHDHPDAAQTWEIRAREPS